MTKTNQFETSLVTLEDLPKVEEFLDAHFFLVENVNVSVGFTLADAKCYIHECFLSWVPEKVSYVTRDSTTGQIVGCSMNTIIRADCQDCFNQMGRESNTPKARLVYNILDKMGQTFLVFEEKKAKKVLELGILAADAKHAGKGIGSNLVKTATDRGAEIGCDYVQSIATAPQTQAIARKQGWTLHKEIDCETFEIDGKSVMDCSKMTTKYFHVVYKKLS